jgi:glutamine synthetase
MTDVFPGPFPKQAFVQTPTLPAHRLLHFIGSRPAEWTVSDLVRVIRDLRIRVVTLMHVGGDGWLKALDFVPQDVAHLHDILSGGERADGSSLFGSLGIPVGASDIVIRPRPSTAFIDPFSPEPTLAVLCSHHARDGSPLVVSPDTVLRNAYERLRREMGVDLHALGEVEYFLGKRRSETDVYSGADRGYHAASPFVFGEPLRRQALALLAEIGVPVKYGHSEVGCIQADEEGLIWEQHEIEMGLQPLPAAADSVAICQWVLRNLAHRSGFRCNFEPILQRGHAGTGMHFHLAPMVNGRPDAYDRSGELTDHAKWLIGGLVCFGASLMPFGNRAQSSFVRLAQAKEAPSTVTWGRFDRRALVRLPIVPTDEEGNPTTAETIEFRLPDGSAHPHLLLAGVAQSMVAGRSIDDLEAVLESTAAAGRGEGRTPLPRNFAEAAELLRQNRGVLEDEQVFPRQMIDRLLETLRQSS